MKPKKNIRNIPVSLEPTRLVMLFNGSPEFRLSDEQIARQTRITVLSLLNSAVETSSPESKIRFLKLISTVLETWDNYEVMLANPGGTGHGDEMTKKDFRNAVREVRAELILFSKDALEFAPTNRAERLLKAVQP
jgi:hypothetical protein